MNILQGLAWLLICQSAGEALARLAHLRPPGPVLGLLLLIALLQWPAVRAPVGAAADALLAHLSLLFVPVGVGVMTHLGLLQQYGWQILLAISLSTWVGLAVTAGVLKALLRPAAGTPSTAPTTTPSTAPTTAPTTTPTTAPTTTPTTAPTTPAPPLPPAPPGGAPP